MSLTYISNYLSTKCFSSIYHPKNKNSYTNHKAFPNVFVYLLPPVKRHRISVLIYPSLPITMAEPVSIFITAAVLPLVLATIQSSLQLALDAMPEIHDKRNRRAIKKLDALSFKAKKGEFTEKGITLKILEFPPPKNFKS